MILVDTSVWVDHFRSEIPRLSELLLEDLILSHPFIVGELALGQLKGRAKTLRSFQRLNVAIVATESEVMDVIERFKLDGVGIGYIDVQLLVSAMLTPQTQVWTHDKRMAGAAVAMSIAAYFPISH